MEMPPEFAIEARSVAGDEALTVARLTIYHEIIREGFPVYHSDMEVELDFEQLDDLVEKLLAIRQEACLQMRPTLVRTINELTRNLKRMDKCAGGTHLATNTNFDCTKALALVPPPPLENPPTGDRHVLSEIESVTEIDLTASGYGTKYCTESDLQKHREECEKNKLENYGQI